MRTRFALKKQQKTNKRNNNKNARNNKVKKKDKRARFVPSNDAKLNDPQDAHYTGEGVGVRGRNCPWVGVAVFSVRRPQRPGGRQRYASSTRGPDRQAAEARESRLAVGGVPRTTKDPGWFRRRAKETLGGQQQRTRSIGTCQNTRDVSPGRARRASGSRPPSGIRAAARSRCRPEWRLRRTRFFLFFRAALQFVAVRT